MIRFLRDYLHALQQAWLAGWQQPSLDTELGRAEAAFEVSEPSTTASDFSLSDQRPLFACPHCGETMCCAQAAEEIETHRWETEL